jgi:hypothetical protein
VGLWRKNRGKVKGKRRMMGEGRGKMDEKGERIKGESELKFEVN